MQSGFQLQHLDKLLCERKKIGILNNFFNGNFVSKKFLIYNNDNKDFL